EDARGRHPGAGRGRPARRRAARAGAGALPGADAVLRRL
ncbi:MAG: hypothetical protein AVDCRST_MAG13-2562, partial [uncultured Solirubrobacteraceae bacterium]